MKRYYQTILWLIIGLLAISFLGFYKSYFSFFPRFQNTAWLVHFHAIIIFCWFAMLITQGLLAKKGNITLHKKIGKFSYVLAPLVVISFALITDYGQQRQKSPDLLGATIFDGGLFILFYSLAILNRKKTDYHAQYMILSALPFINPGLGRFISPAVSLPVEFLLILTLLFVAYRRKKPYRPYVIALSSFLILLAVIIYISVIQPNIIASIWNLIWG